MPKTINPIRKAIVKENRIKGISKAASLRNAGYAESTATHHASRLSVLKIVDNEILTDKDKRRIIDKAWKVLDESLDNPKHKHTIANTIASKDMTDKKEVNNLHPDKIIISYTKDTQPVKDKEVTP